MSNRRKEMRKARQLLSQLGIKTAAGYLRNRGWSCEGAVALLCGNHNL